MFDCVGRNIVSLFSKNVLPLKNVFIREYNNVAHGILHMYKSDCTQLLTRICNLYQAFSFCQRKLSNTYFALMTYRVYLWNI